MGDFSKLCSTLRGSWTEDPQSCDGEWSAGSLVVMTSASRPEAGAAFHSLLSSSKAQAGCVTPEPGMQFSWSFLLREDVELFVLCNPPPPPCPAAPEQMSVIADGPVGQPPLVPVTHLQGGGSDGTSGLPSWGFWTLVGEQLCEWPASFAVWALPGLTA